MTDSRNDTPHGDDRDLMLSRIVDAEATSNDWLRFRELAAEDASVWAQLSVMQRQQDELERALASATAPAMRVELDDDELDRAMPDAHVAFQNRLNFASRWGGWAAAAALVLVWATGLRPQAPQGPMLEAGLGPRLQEATPDAALQHYLDAGRQSGAVLGEMPERVVLRTTPLEQGGVEVVFVRQIIERQFVERVYRPSQDEHGNRVELPTRVAPAVDNAF